MPELDRIEGSLLYVVQDPMGVSMYLGLMAGTHRLEDYQNLFVLLLRKRLIRPPDFDVLSKHLVGIVRPDGERIWRR